MPSIILIDDEEGARRGFQILLREHDDVEIIGEADSVSSALLADGDYTSVIMEGEVDYFAVKSIGHYEKVLPNSMFVRLSRSLIVNMEQVVNLKVHSRDLADLFMKGVSKPLLLRRVALQKLRSVMK